MIRRASALLLATVVFACTGGGGSIDDPTAPTTPTETPAPAPEVQVVGTSGLEVKAAFASATLGDQGCGDSSGGSGFAPSDSAGKCAPIADDAGASGANRCGGGCRKSTLQISFTTGTTGGPAKVQISTVSLSDVSSGAEIAKLTASNAQVWDKTSSMYKSWDGSLAASASAQVSYTLSTPALDRSYDKKYRIQVTLLIDGKTLILQSDVLAREPDVAT